MSTPPAPVSPSTQHSERPGIFVKLDRFWQRVTEGLELSQLWKQFHADARASYRLYQRDFEKQSPAATRSGFWRTVQGFAWAILEKLTPARRILLLLGLVLLLLPGGGYTHRDELGHVEFVQFDPRFFGGVLLFVLLMLEIADRVIMKRDLEIARDIQKWLLPANPPQIPGARVAFATRPANTVAGDFFDAFPRPAVNSAPHYLLAVADVAGKSIPAALLMATFQASLKTLAATGCSLQELVTNMNQYASTNSQGGLRFTTAFVGEFDPVSRTLDYINAGHNPPILRRASGAIEHLTAGGLPLGIHAEAAYQAGTVTLQPGDWLAVFTDGLVEAVNRLDQEYGEQRLVGVLQSAPNLPPDELLWRVMHDLDLFVGATPQHDDVTCMLVRLDPV